MERLLPHLIPVLSEEEKGNILDYYYFAQMYRVQLSKEMLKELEDHPVFGKMIRETPEEVRLEQNKISEKFQAEAILNGQWEPYIHYQINMGIMYAKLGLDFYSWFEIITMARRLLIPKIMGHFGEHKEKVFSAIYGLDRFMDIGMCTLGEAYILEKKAIVERQKREQEQLNKEMEQFVYIASHDLQEPLNTVKSFISLIEDDHGEKLRGEPMEYLGYIKEASGRMTNLIASLLEYSRVGRKSKLEKTSLNELVDQVLLDLKALIVESKAEIHVGELPALNVFPIEIKLLFQNLISNGIKFTKKNSIPKLKIDAVKEDGLWQFTVEDNGIGIDPKYSEKIFVIFQRLHGTREYPGTGIGLAHCKKVVELHEGKIWVESKPGEGSKFHFTLSEKN